MSEHRIVLIADHVIAQFHDTTGWYTASKANNNDEGDFAVWDARDEDTALRKAVKVVGDVPVVRATCTPLQRGNAWYTDGHDQHARSYSEALRALARSL